MNTIKNHQAVGDFRFILRIFTATNLVNAATWRYAHEENKGDVQDVYAQRFKEYIEKTLITPFRYIALANLGNLMTSWNRPRPVF